MFFENQYRTRTCAAVGESDVGRRVRLAGWVENIRDHGGVLFLDLRDHYGTVQVVIHDDGMLEGVMKEAVVSIEGEVALRAPETVNPKLATGTVELKAESLEVIGRSQGGLPFEVQNSTEIKEELRLRYRYLDLRLDPVARLHEPLGKVPREGFQPVVVTDHHQVSVASAVVLRDAHPSNTYFPFFFILNIGRSFFQGIGRFTIGDFISFLSNPHREYKVVQ